MQKLTPSNKVYIAKSKIKNAGRGVFARMDISKGEIIEKCPVIEIAQKDTALLVESALTSYFYFLGKRKEKTVLALGFGSIYNHSKTPNADYTKILVGSIMSFVALRNIKKDEEITVNYNPKPAKNKLPLWFETKQSYK